MEWQPDSQSLNELQSVIRDAIRPHRDQLLLHNRLLSFNVIPEYNNYLAYILVNMTNQDSYLRAVAGLTLKNNLLNNFESIHESILDYVKKLCLTSLDYPDADSTIRRTISSVITAIMVRGQTINWPECLPIVVGKLIDGNDRTTNQFTVEMALDTLQMISEDNAFDVYQTIEPMSGRPVLDYIIPQLIPFAQHPNTKFKVSAISAINQFVMLQASSLQGAHINTYIQSLITTVASRQEFLELLLYQDLCRSFTMLLDKYTTELLPYLNPIINYMIFCNQQTKNAKLALEACDFWHQFARLENPVHHRYVIPYLPHVIPVLLNSLKYSDEDILLFGDSMSEVSEDAYPPQGGGLYNKNLKYYHAEQQATYYRQGQHNNGFYNSSDEEYDDEDADEDDDLEDEEFFSEWTLRKFSATSLDALACTFKMHVIDILLPLLNQALFAEDWKIVESGILALGATAEGGMRGILPHLPAIIPYLIRQLSNSNIYIRYISCWTISRFSAWVVSQHEHYQSVLGELLKCILDPSERVQEAACSAFSTLVEESTQKELVPYLSVILNHLTRALRLYRQRNLKLLYDTMGTLAESVGSSLNQSEFIAVLMPPLISKWNRLEDTDPDLFPLLMCLTHIASSLGTGFLPFTEPVITRCVLLISRTLQNAMLRQEEAYYDEDEFFEENEDFIVVPLDLLSGIVQGLGTKVEPFVIQTNLLPLLTVCAHYESRYAVLQPTYALIGDLAKACFHLLPPYLDKIMAELIRQIKENDDNAAFKSVRNNAIWAIGEISLRWTKEAMEPYLDPLLQQLIPILQSIIPPSHVFSASQPPPSPTPTVSQQLQQLQQQQQQQQEQRREQQDHQLNSILSQASYLGSMIELQVNTVITIGRLGIHHSDRVAHYLSLETAVTSHHRQQQQQQQPFSLCRAWLYRSRGLREDDEKDTSFQGFCNVVLRHFLVQTLDEMVRRLCVFSN
ncbi:armadillo-type protein [Mycotypha africana]|uniref:armadillo-type protein n=1 Tax=Mycotypha africana TaxID=64632 RepID=UPI0023012DC7|nr:armadillo-type protein [Mycotypha africana]KAI8988345.1 armadillo-type protein [Mycotypha africana]